jgi:pilus assembly protein Flp/PilA
LLANDRGATSIEYALLAALIALAIIGSATTIGTQLNSNFVEVSEQFPEFEE